MRGVTALAAAVLAAATLSAFGSSGVSAAQGPGSIVFVAGAGTVGVGVGNTEIVAARPSGGVRDLTSTSAASEYDATWSPDGSRVVFFRRPATIRGKSPVEGLYVWTPGHGTPQRIASCPYYCHWYSFAWSPDNRQIAFEYGTEVIKVMNADGSDLHSVCSVKRCGQGVGDPAWSPDGRRLVFDTKVFAPAESEGYTQPVAIWIANADGSGVRQLTQPKCNTVGVLGPKSRGCSVDTGPVWSPNGRLIAFTRSNARIPWLRHATGPARPLRFEVMRADGSHLHVIFTCGGSRDFGCYTWVPPVWAPDSKAIAYTPVHSDHASSFRITTLAGKTTTIRTCVRSGCASPYELAWSPDGKQLAFVSHHRTSPSVWVIGRDGKGLHRISRGGLCCLAWVRNTSLSG